MLYDGIEVTDPNAIWWIEENQRIKALPIVSTHDFITLGSKTKNGGVVHTAISSRAQIKRINPLGISPTKSPWKTVKKSLARLMSAALPNWSAMMLHLSQK
jgi:hypothetical protein